MLALVSSVAYGISDFLGGRVSRSVSLLSVLMVSQGAALTLLTVLVSVRGDSLPEGRFLVYAALAGVSEAVAVAALYRGFAVGVISLVAPVAATAPLIPVLIGLVLGEVPTPLQAVGIGLAVLGVVCVSRERPAETGSAKNKTARSILFGLLAAFGFGCFYVAMDGASVESVPWALFMARSTSLSLFAAAALIGRARVAVPRGLFVTVVAIGLLIVAADTMYAVASTSGLLGVVAVLSSLHSLVTILLARIFLQERLSKSQGLGVLLCLGGVMTIAMG